MTNRKRSDGKDSDWVVTAGGDVEIYEHSCGAEIKVGKDCVIVRTPEEFEALAYSALWGLLAMEATDRFEQAIQDAQSKKAESDAKYRRA